MDKKITPVRQAWKGTMTGRERFKNQLNYKSVDRCFNMEFGWWEENYTEWKEFVDNGVTNEEEGNIFFNFDPIHVVTPNIWASPLFESKVISETENTYIMTDHEGHTVEVNKKGASIPRFISAAITTPDDWKQVKEERFRLDDPSRIVDVEAIKKQFPADRDCPVGINAGSMIGRIRDILTFEGLCYAVYDYPDMIEDMVETHCQLVENALDQILPHVDFDYASGWEDICFNHGPIVSIDFFKEVIMPRYKRINKKLKEHGIDIWYTDCDGDVRPLVPIFLESGINCLFPYEVNSCVHPGDLLDQYEGELRIMGGFNKMKMIEGKEAIKEYMESLDKYVAKGGYIPFCDHRCPPDVSFENYMYYLDLKEKMWGMG